MSHPNRFPPELLPYDNAMEAFLEEHRQKNLHLVDKFAGEQADSPVGHLALSSTQRTAMTSPAKPLSLWARAWLKVAKGIIG